MIELEGHYYKELLPPGKTMDSDLYCQQLMRLKQEVEKKRPELINRKGSRTSQRASNQNEQVLDKSSIWSSVDAIGGKLTNT
ncbi:hypothetical protein EVAR_46943_1 [Eumeta japonica]|uniref:Uncharacterized protein n=1 Tax=Eumeta variegata TaxID=151549 RepID=A0A4C1YNZ8_EUMVA|nr:hypothetical protein EVAR_46943_1 [Eumeta japonica]